MPFEIKTTSLPDNLFSEGKETKNRNVIVLASILFLVATYLFLFSSPLSFPKDELITIKEGSSLAEVSNFLESKKIIKSKIAFQSIMILWRGEKSVLAGDYYFPERKSLFSVISIITDNKRPGSIKITIPEGLSVEQMALVYESKLLGFDKTFFIEKASPLEGYLFPDTYFFLPTSGVDEIIREMSLNFENKIDSVGEKLELFGEDLQDVITMASILELEARTTESRRIIAGILWKRLELGIPLQVDATFLYINGKKTNELTVSDLEIDSPYNTYKYRGLPKGPISNPGLDSILSAITPIKTNYLFYLSDSDGEMHYAEDFEEHKRNKNIYIY